MKPYFERGAFFVLLPFILAAAVWFGTHAWLANVAAGDSNPDQNAMVIALLANVASLVINAGILGYGLDCLVKGYRQAKQAKQDQHEAVGPPK